MLEVAVQMDPLEKINFAGDSTFAIMLEAARRGHRLWFYTPDHCRWRPAASPRARRRSPSATSPAIITNSARRASSISRASTWCCCGKTRPSTSPTSPRPTFSSASAARALVVNDPASVRNAPEKLFVMQFPELMPPTLITRDSAAIERFRAEHGEVVMKPLYGHGGASVFKVARRDPNFGSLFDLFSTIFREPWVVQRFLPAVSLGDKRILLVDGEPLGAVNRVPAEDDIRSNMVRGGAGGGDRTHRRASGKSARASGRI